MLPEIAAHPFERVSPVEPDMSRIGFEHANQHPRKCCLSRSRRSDNSQGRAGIHGEGDGLEDRALNARNHIGQRFDRKLSRRLRQRHFGCTGQGQIEKLQ